jgi:hypothetical protein
VRKGASKFYACNRSFEGCVKLGVTAIEKRVSNHKELLERYAIALRTWSDVRHFYPASSAEVFAATNLVDELELQLRDHPPRLNRP